MKKIAAASAVALLAGLVATGPAQAEPGDSCSGRAAGANLHSDNHAPVANNDTAKVIAGLSGTIKVLANDTDVDGDVLTVAGAKSAHGTLCINTDGTIDYYADSGPNDYVDTLTYGVTDGDLYRTATVKVSVEGVAVVRGKLDRALKTKGKKAKRAAQVSFTNPNRRAVTVAVFSPKGKTVGQRAVGAGKTYVLTTKQRRIEFAVFIESRDDFNIVNYGEMDTKTGRQNVETLDEDEFFRPAHSEREVLQRVLSR